MQVAKCHGDRVIPDTSQFRHRTLVVRTANVLSALNGITAL